MAWFALSIDNVGGVKEKIGIVVHHGVAVNQAFAARGHRHASRIIRRYERQSVFSSS